MASFHRDESESLARDALSSMGKSPEERFQMFADLMATADMIQATLSPEERLRRAEIARQLDPLPDPWWKHFRAEALAEYQSETPYAERSPRSLA